MNSNSSNGQFPGFENFQTTAITANLTSQSTLTESATVSRVNVPHVTSMQHARFLQPQQTFQPIAFFYRPPNDFYNYCVKIREISVDMVIQSFNEFSNNVSNSNFTQNEYIFLYQHQINNRIYQVACELVSPSLITNFLNKTIYGIETEQNIEQEQPQLTFTLNQKENLQFYLVQYLSRYLLLN